MKLNNQKLYRKFGYYIMINPLNQMDSLLTSFGSLDTNKNIFDKNSQLNENKRQNWREYKLFFSRYDPKRAKSS